MIYNYEFITKILYLFLIFNIFLKGLLRKPRGEGKREIKHKAVALPMGDDDDEDDDSDFDGAG